MTFCPCMLRKVFWTSETIEINIRPTQAQNFCGSRRKGHNPNQVTYSPMAS